MHEGQRAGTKQLEPMQHTARREGGAERGGAKRAHMMPTSRTHYQYASTYEIVCKPATHIYNSWEVRNT
jgi:hypothetical protein